MYYTWLIDPLHAYLCCLSRQEHNSKLVYNINIGKINVGIDCRVRHGFCAGGNR
ncbi:hypothetical protein PAXRUDRAFT_827470 [Paxillus rubicundulus Ve08.2h10]|uniref:Uncharacterized protein n=1 Tax=Paxillus rubicundulus Ve08.2h10 TaxID=930991 RepID=A0A0D0DQT9_9AGAM|nr:hypothetical protein PAXRUDRAFT_827470 [Paxillus rubicundulus Ve08.2h10]